MGSLFPDLGRRRDLIHSSQAIEDAIVQHQAIDALTDQHPAHARLRAMLRPSFGRFSGIVADVLLDHELAANWNDYRAEAFARFREQVYRQLADESWRVSGSVARTMERMREGDWLGAYQTTSGIERILGMMSQKISHRLKRSIDLRPASAWIVGHRSELTDCFGPLWAMLLANAAPGVCGHDRG